MTPSHGRIEECKKVPGVGFGLLIVSLHQLVLLNQSLEPDMGGQGSIGEVHADKGALCKKYKNINKQHGTALHRSPREC